MTGKPSIELLVFRARPVAGPFDGLLTNKTKYALVLQVLSRGCAFFGQVVPRKCRPSRILWLHDRSSGFASLTVAVRRILFNCSKRHAGSQAQA